MTFKSKKWFYKSNGQKGGRPKQDSKIQIELQNIHHVILSPKQYNTLLNKYDYNLVVLAITTLNKLLAENIPAYRKYAGKNHYALFRSDGRLINETKYRLANN